MKKKWIYSLLYKSYQLNKPVLKILGRFGGKFVDYPDSSNSTQIYQCLMQ